MLNVIFRSQNPTNDAIHVDCNVEQISLQSGIYDVVVSTVTSDGSHPQVVFEGLGLSRCYATLLSGIVRLGNADRFIMAVSVVEIESGAIAEKMALVNTSYSEYILYSKYTI